MLYVKLQIGGPKKAYFYAFLHHIFFDVISLRFMFGLVDMLTFVWFGIVMNVLNIDASWMDSSFSLARRCSCLSLPSSSSTDVTILGCLWNSRTTEKCCIENI